MQGLPLFKFRVLYVLSCFAGTQLCGNLLHQVKRFSGGLKKEDSSEEASAYIKMQQTIGLLEDLQDWSINKIPTLLGLFVCRSWASWSQRGLSSHMAS